MSDQHALWPYGPNHPKTIRNNEFWQKQSQLPPEARIMQGPAPGRRTTIAHPDHPLMGGPGFGPGEGTMGMPPGYSGGGWGRHFDREGKAIPESGGIPGQSTTMMGRNPDGTPITLPGLGGGAMTQGPAGQRQGQRLEQQAPRPEGFQRVATGIADWLTGNKWDMDQRGKGAKFLKEITKGSKDGNGKTFADNVPNMAPLPEPGINPLEVLMQGPALGQGTGGLQPHDPSIMMEETWGGGKRYNPYEGQTITLPDGRVVPRTPENSVPGP